MAEQCRDCVWGCKGPCLVKRREELKGRSEFEVKPSAIVGESLGPNDEAAFMQLTKDLTLQEYYERLKERLASERRSVLE